MTFLDLIMMAMVVRLIDLSEPSLALPLPTAYDHPLRRAVYYRRASLAL